MKSLYIDEDSKIGEITQTIFDAYEDGWVVVGGKCTLYWEISEKVKSGERVYDMYEVLEKIIIKFQYEDYWTYIE